MTDRIFTPEEAQSLIPWLRGVFDALEPLKEEMALGNGRIRDLIVRMRSNGGSKAEQDLEQARSDLEETQNRINEHVHAIIERGIIVRSVERGLVDFPSLRDGRPVHLCWLVGEPEIRHWHEVDAGFGGRQPL